MKSFKQHLNVCLQDCGSKKGFTLIEAIIYIGIIGLFLATMVRFVFSIGGIKNKVYAQQEVQANTRIALETISQRIKSADGINFGFSTFDTDPGVLSLSTTSVAADPMVISLSQDDGVLQLSEGVGSPVNVTSNEVKVTNLVFTNLTATSTKPHIRVEFTVEYTNDGDNSFRYSQSVQSAISLRQ